MHVFDFQQFFNAINFMLILTFGFKFIQMHIFLVAIEKLKV